MNGWPVKHRRKRLHSFRKWVCCWSYKTRLIRSHRMQARKRTPCKVRVVMQSIWTKRAHNETRALNNKNPFFHFYQRDRKPSSINNHHRKLLLKPLSAWVIWFAFLKRKSTALYLFFHSNTDRCFPISKFRVLDLGKKRTRSIGL